MYHADIGCSYWERLGVGYMGALCKCVCVRLVTQSCPTLCNPMDQPTRLLCPWDSPGENTGVGCHALLQGIFPSRDWTRVSRIAGRFFTNWATREASFVRSSLIFLQLWNWSKKLGLFKDINICKERTLSY